jgi:non-ribosomal peptide synthase protein (TIGR01720 family)
LDPEETAALLGEVHAAYNTNVEDLLLAALARTIAHWSGLPRVLIGVERHGREQLVEGVDLARTIGWLTSYFPVCFDVPDEDSGALLRNVKDTLRAIPHRGASYGLLRYMRDDLVARTLSRHQPPEIVFNFAGRFGSKAVGGAAWLQSRPPFASRAGENGRGYRIEINALVVDGRLRIDWTASHAQYHESTIEHLLRTLLDEIRLLIQHALTADSSGYTPADFPEAGLSQEDLDRFLEGLG